MLLGASLGASTGVQAALDAAQAELTDAQGNKIGTVMLTEAVHGVLIQGELQNLAPGTHGFHIHETGKCEPPFDSAGGHFNPMGKEHGFRALDGIHAGDLPNIHVGADGRAAFEIITREVTLGEGKGMNSVFDEDGSALIVHEKPDDYLTKPTGGSGARIACGVIKEAAVPAR
jgi:Cu-Zn family superoxide dismutase